MTGFGVPLDFRGGFVPQRIPEDFATRFVERKQTPLSDSAIIRGSDVAVESDLQPGLPRHDRRPDVDPVAPDDRTGVSKAGDGRLPAHVLPVLDIPADRRGGARGDTGRLYAAKLRPVPGIATLRQRKMSNEGEEARSARGRHSPSRPAPAIPHDGDRRFRDCNHWPVGVPPLSVRCLTCATRSLSKADLSN